MERPSSKGGSRSLTMIMQRTWQTVCPSLRDHDGRGFVASISSVMMTSIAVMAPLANSIILDMEVSLLR
jgi:hypothetical protein